MTPPSFLSVCVCPSLHAISDENHGIVRRHAGG
jgi:hypothetical protein